MIDVYIRVTVALVVLGCFGCMILLMLSNQKKDHEIRKLNSALDERNLYEKDQSDILQGRVVNNDLGVPIDVWNIGGSGRLRLKRGEFWKIQYIRSVLNEREDMIGDVRILTTLFETQDGFTLMWDTEKKRF